MKKLRNTVLFELRCEKTCLWGFANNKRARNTVLFRREKTCLWGFANNKKARNTVLIGPQCEKTCLWGFAHNKWADQPAHPTSLISIFVIHFLERMVFKLAIGEFSIFYLVPVAMETGLSFRLSLVGNLEDRFCPDEAHLRPTIKIFVPPLQL